MALQITNNATTTLAAAIGSSDLTLTVAAGTGALFPVLGAGDYFYATLQSVTNTYEIVRVTARTDDVMIITRAQENTIALPFPVNTRLELRVTAQNIKSVLEDLNYLLL